MSYTDFIKKKYGASEVALDLADKCKKFFTFNKLNESDDSIKFIGVNILKDVEFPGSSHKLTKGDTIYGLEFHQNGWISVYESNNDTRSYLAVTNPILEDIFGVTQPAENQMTNLVAISAIQLDGIAKISEVVKMMKNISVQDANSLKNILGPSIEERILRNILDAVFFADPLEAGLSNGV